MEKIAVRMARTPLSLNEPNASAQGAEGCRAGDRGSRRRAPAVRTRSHLRVTRRTIWCTVAPSAPAVPARRDWGCVSVTDQLRAILDQVVHVGGVDRPFGG